MATAPGRGPVSPIRLRGGLSFAWPTVGAPIVAEVNSATIQQCGGVSWLGGANDFPCGFQNLGTLWSYFAMLNSTYQVSALVMPWVSKLVGVLAEWNEVEGLLYFNTSSVAQAWWSFRLLGAPVPSVIHPMLDFKEASIWGISYIAVATVAPGAMPDDGFPVADACTFGFDWVLANGSGYGPLVPL